MNIFNEINTLWSGDTVTVDREEKKEKNIPVIFMDSQGHSCKDPENCRLNTTFNPYWCMQVHDNSHNEVEE